MARIGALLDEPGEGAVIPTERDLSERYDVARETVRQAIRELLLEGTQTAQSLTTVNVLAGASAVSFRFRYTGSDNWYWVIDGVNVTTS